jgi:hypothetical protein
VRTRAALAIGADSSFIAAPNEETVRFYQATDFLYSSLQVTFGLTNLEAMPCPCRVVTSNLSSLREISNEAALFADHHDWGSIARHQRAAASGAPIRRTKGSRG